MRDLDLPSDPARFLRYSLRANAAFSATSGLLFVLARDGVARLLGALGPGEILSIGVQLAIFAGALVWLASRPRIPVPLALSVVAADLLWVVATIFALYADVFTRSGAWAALGVGHLVLGFAVLQTIGIQRLRRGRAMAAS